MYVIAVLVMLVGVLGFMAAFAGVLTIAPLSLWAGIAIVGLIVAVLTRRPSD